MNEKTTSEEVAKKLKEIYLYDLKKIILKNLTQLREGEVCVEECDTPWFGDVFSWTSTLQKECMSTLSKDLPALLRREDKKSKESEESEELDKLDKLGKELHNLLPQDDLVKAFLPIILTNYVSRRSQMSDVYDILFGDLCNEALPRQLEKYWAPSSWKERYKNISSKNCKGTNFFRTLPIYVNAIQFLFFLKDTKDCNIGLSFYVFDQLTGYLRLFDYRASFFCMKVEEEYSERLKNMKGGTISIAAIAEKTKYDDGIIAFVNDVTAELTQGYPTCSATSGPDYDSNHTPEGYDLNLNLFVFIKNLKLELLKDKNDEVSLDKKDSLRDFQMYDDIIYAELFAAESSITDNFEPELNGELEYLSFKSECYKFCEQWCCDKLTAKDIEKFKKKACEHFNPKGLERH